MNSKGKNIGRLIRFSGFALIAGAFGLFLWGYLARARFLEGPYLLIVEFLEDFQASVISIENKWIIIIVLEMLFIIKGFIPGIPLPVLMLIPGAVFSMPIALLLNIGGLVLLVSVRYSYGYHHKKNVSGLLMRYEVIEKEISKGKDSNPLILFLLRFVPIFPVNQVSSVYGSMRFNYINFVLLSMLGFTQKLIAYSIMGRHIYNPFTFAFSAPLFTIMIISGLAMLGIHALLKITKWSFVGS
ncbi:MAG: hypothetical protein FWF08_08045 [Oscillospiraceae bacterium]|nr:hypothetical protein [Oscillospiraceae bacterium]